MTQIELPGIPASNSLPALREREADLERKVAEMRHEFEVIGHIADGFADASVELSTVKKQIAGMSLTNTL